MMVDGEEEPQEKEGVFDLDFEVVDPKPAQMGAYSPIVSESSVNNLNDY